jgi:hypothetical protein
MFMAPREGWRQGEVRENRTRKDWAEQVRKPVDEDFPLAEKILLVMDNANQRFENTHHRASLHETYPKEEAKGIKDRLELHYTPKHGSWLNMVERELKVINNQGLPARVGTLEEMRQRVRVRNEVRNGKGSTIIWWFRTADARIKLKYLYPQFNS